MKKEENKERIDLIHKKHSKEGLSKDEIKKLFYLQSKESLVNPRITIKEGKRLAQLSQNLLLIKKEFEKLLKNIKEENI